MDGEGERMAHLPLRGTGRGTEGGREGGREGDDCTQLVDGEGELPLRGTDSIIVRKWRGGKDGESRHDKVSLRKGSAGRSHYKGSL